MPRALPTDEHVEDKKDTKKQLAPVIDGKKAHALSIILGRIKVNSDIIVFLQF